MSIKIKTLEDLIRRYPCLLVCKESIITAYDIMVATFMNNGKLLIAGNGGSAADADHIVGELMKNFCLNRGLDLEFKKNITFFGDDISSVLLSGLNGVLPAISLTHHTALTTACLNDNDGKCIFAQQVYGFGNSNDVFFAISTSGNSLNILLAAYTAKAKGLKVIGLTGRDGGKLNAIADSCIIVPEQETYKIQELHLPIYHTLCLMLEERFFS